MGDPLSREIESKARAYVEFALSSGADHAVAVGIDRIVFDPRTYLKCLFGCGGGNPKTPCHSQPGRVKPWEYEPILRRYAWGVLIHSKVERAAQEISLAMERKAFGDGHYFAFSLSDCALCEACARAGGGDCAHYEDTRPSMHGAGIDVFETAKRLGLPLRALTYPWKAEDLNFYSLVLVE